MAAVTTPYATGTITSVSGTTINLSGGAAAGWVGRCIRLTTGAGAGQTRKILTAPSATQITVDFAFANTYARASMVPFPDVDPSPGDGFVISYLIPDFADGTSVIVDPGAFCYRFVGASSFAGGAFVYASNARIDLTSSTITCNQALQANRVAWRLGDIDAFGNVFNGCHLLDAATAPSGFGTGGASTFDPDFEAYGSILRFTGAGPFWRMHTDSGERVRIIGVRVDGGIGGRMIGTRSIFDAWEVYNDQSASGPFNAKAPFGSISDIRITNSLQAVYHFWPDSQTLEIEGIKLGPNVTRGVRFANSTTAGQTLTIKDIDIAAWSALPNLYNNGNGTYSNTFRISQYLTGSYRTAAGVAITESTRFVVRDVAATTVYNSTVLTGLLPRQTLKYRDMTILTTGNFTWASAGGTTFAPYLIASASYLNQPATANLPLQTSQDVTLLALPDSYVTNTNRTEVDAYTSIYNTDQLYDRAKAWTVDNLAAANPSFGAQLANGNGTVLDLGAFNLVVDATAASVFDVTGSIITIKSSSFAAGTTFGSMTTTAVISAANGAVIAAPFTDANNSGSISVVGLAVTDTADMRKASDNSLIATRTGDGPFAVSPANVGASVYFERKVGGVLVVSSIITPVTLAAGINPEVPLFGGAAVQVAQAPEITAIKAKTDSLTFTTAGAVDANIQYVNDVAVKGTGTESDPWNPE